MAAMDLLSVPAEPFTRLPTSVLPATEQTPSFVISAANKSYKHQYSNIYYARLQMLRPFVLENAARRWKDIKGKPQYEEQMLNVTKGQICYIVGTVYMDMPLKPNVLEDLSRDHSIPAPPPREKYHSADDVVTLEDESGRICLVGDKVKSAGLVTGVILAALGMEKNSGDFEVIDICFAGMAPQPSAGLWRSSVGQQDEMEVDDDAPRGSDEWIAVVSGLEIGAPSPSDAQIEMLVEYLAGEAGGVADQSEVARISRIILAGNSLSSVVSSNGVDEMERRPKRYGHDATIFSPHPARNLGAHLLDIARSMPIHIVPGASDPSGTILPQQPMPRAMLGGAASFASFSSETNPTYICIRPGISSSASTMSSKGASTSKGKAKVSSKDEAAQEATGPSRSILVTSGQPLDDMYKYVPTPPHSRLNLVEATLHWRHIAPTAPDTLWCHPYFAADPFIITETPDVYLIGCQPRFATSLVEEKADEGLRKCRVVLVPNFRESGTLVLVNLRTLDVKTVQFAVMGVSA